ncbi:MAG: M23 family metallopeptidase [Acidobacteria bacterium]|nr:M23 family metallopeptidase [Acidobacteriota bacterium]
MRSMVLTCAVVLCLPIAGSVGQSPDVRIEPFPERPYLNATRGGLELHNDFIVSNDTARSLTLTRVEMSVFGRDGRLVQRRFVSAANGGPNSGLLTIPRREVGPGEKLTLFNPFHVLDADLEIGRAVFEFTLAGAEATVTRSVPVHPVRYESSTSLELPLRGRSLVWDGHDFYSHHRRQDPSRLPLAEGGILDVPVRYAYDFSVVDEAGDLHRGEAAVPTEWYGYGASVHAPGSGVVVAVANEVPDNRIVDGRLRYPRPPPAALNARLLGNHVVIDHENDEYSVLAHLRAGSVTLRTGDRVTRGDRLGEIGFSGDTGFHVHVHYHLASGADLFGTRALPAQFERFSRVVGSRTVFTERGPIATGDILVSNAGR